MTENDARRWDRKWADVEQARPPSRLLLEHRRLLRGGRAADVACGLGQNAIWLAHHGYRSLGLDISHVALAQARQQARAESLADRMLFVRCDLTIWSLAPRSLDLVCVFRFLERDLFPDLQQSLRPGGLLFYETRHRGLLHRRPDSNQAYLLERGELRSAFADLHVLFHEEGSENARLVARRPENRAAGTVSRETGNI